METTEIHIDKDLVFKTPDDGRSIRVRAQTARLYPEGPFTLDVEMSPSAWNEIWERQLFQLNPDTVPEEAYELEDDGLIQIELALDEESYAGVLAAADPTKEFLEGLVATGDSNVELNQAVSWIALTVTQTLQVPGDPAAELQIGFRTFNGVDSPDSGD